MKDFFTEIKEEIASAVSKAVGVEVSAATIVPPPDPRMGDLSLPCFSFSKMMTPPLVRGGVKISPGEAAAKIHALLKPWGTVAKIELAGPYVNFSLDREKAVRAFFGKKETAGGGKLRGERIMIEYVSPNNNKPLHLGHLRNAFLGESVARLLEAQGAKVFRACLFNDRGLHIAKSMLAYRLWGDGSTPKSAGKKGDKFVGDLYVEFEKKSKENPELAKQAETLVIAWEQGDKSVRALWKKLSDWALDGAGTTLKRLGMKFDVVYFENKLWEKGKKVVEEGLKSGIFKKNETGAVVADLEQIHSPEKVVMRSDGTAIYATTDLYLGDEKFKKKKLTRAIWCVGGEQDLYLKQLFAMYRLIGYPWVEKCEHLSYGLVFLPEGKMKSREGKVVEADDLLDELQGVALQELRARQKLSEKEFARRAEAIAQAALRFYFLAVTPPSIVHFNPKESLAFTGRTGPYLLYTYARIASLLRKAKGAIPRGQISAAGATRGRTSSVAFSDHEWDLLMKLARFSETVSVAAGDRNPAHLANFLYELCQSFAHFYEAVPVLAADGVVRKTRLALCDATRGVLKQGLSLLGIKPLEEM